ncbi:hypothetical protein [Oscillatoria sp. HE19RPO]|uniref:hypothetical protein n=1 Tax=Oscillatoria sp. HE19RPO TaxID=2954806 RepID=UPI0020C496D5|nr:hypothetical protein [Oscillatoria sp. HE19RPO]
MNIKLVESLAQVVQSLSPEERSLLEEKLKAHQDQTSAEGKERPLYETVYERAKAFYETATPAERAKAFREWAQSHPRNQPYLSDEAISRESIYGERG